MADLALDRLKKRVAAGKATELDKTELLVRTVKAQAAAAVTNREDGADELLARAMRLEQRVATARAVERLNALTTG